MAITEFFLLNEDGGILLLESGGKLVLYRTGTADFGSREVCFKYPANEPINYPDAPLKYPANTPIRYPKC